MSEREGTPTYRAAMAVGEAVLGGLRAAWRRLPPRTRDRLERRFFGAIFQVTRVTNDDYGFRPDAPGSGQGGARPSSKENET